MSVTLVSVVISNKNGAQWLPKCFASIRQQTIFNQLEVIMADNCSVDGSSDLARRELADFPRAKVLNNPKDMGIAGGQNAGAAAATGKYLFFLNNDAWLEPDCLEILVREFEAQGAAAASPLELSYDEQSMDDRSKKRIDASGIDWFGLPTRYHSARPEAETVFFLNGCGFIVDAALFRQVGGFDTDYFLNAEETDLSWRLWIAGGKITGVPSAKLHHRGAAGVNPAGDTKVVEARTSDTKRYLSNRNGILTLLKNSQHVLLLLLIPHLLLLMAESVMSLILVRRWSHVRRAYLSAIVDAFRMMPHVLKWRRVIGGFRRRSDIWMLRYLCLRPSRWDEIERFVAFGVLKVDKR
jgi:GT2 family glycosyltransferase